MEEVRHDKCPASQIMNSETKISKQNVGNAGEYYLASRLSAEDFIATITLGRTERYDILAISPKGRTIKLSVKTRIQSSAYDFPLSARDELLVAEDFYYGFVRLNGFSKEPDFWIMPSRIVAQLIKDGQKKWMGKLGKKNKPHKETSLRILAVAVPEKQKYLYPENWEQEVKKYYKNIEQLK